MEIQGTLQIKIIKADLTVNADWFGKMDPYVIIKLNELSSQTSVKKNAGKTPSWDENFSFRAKEGDIIRLDVFDWDFLKTDDLVGKGVLELKDLSLLKKEIKVQLYKNGTHFAGDIYVSTKFFPYPQEYLKIIKTFQNEISHEIKEIERLQQKLRNTNKLLNFEEEQKNRKTVIAEAMMIGDRKDHLEEEFKKLEHIYEIQIQELELSVQTRKKTLAMFRDNMKKTNDYISSINNEIVLYKNPTDQGKLLITCKDGNFTRSTKTLGTMDPYVIFSLKTNTYKTSKIKNGGKNPNWEENFELKRGKGDNILKVEAFHENDLIGFGFFNINWITIKGTEHETHIKLLFYKEILKDVGYINVLLKFEKE